MNFNKIIKIQSIILLTSMSHAQPQHHIIISPNEKVFNIKGRSSANSIIEEQSHTHQINCSNKAILGYPPDKYQPSLSGGAGLSHRRVEAMRYEPPANGTIDSIFFLIVPTIDSSTIQIPATIRIFKSNIYPHTTAGVISHNNYLPWGYYKCTDDYDMGITPYKDEATDTNWICTNEDSTWDPLGEELWGLGGFPITLRGDKDYHIIGIDLEESLGYKPMVEKDEPFWICIRNPLFHKIEYVFVSIGVAAYYDGSKPWRNWTFCEHEFPPYRPYGWVGFNFGNLNIWYSMTLNYPYPEFIPMNEAIVSGKCEVEDIMLTPVKFCAPQYLDSAGISSVWIDYQFNSDDWDSVKTFMVGDTMLIAIINGQPAGTLVNLRCRVVDYVGNTKQQFFYSYRVAGLNQTNFTADTSAYFDWYELDTTNMWIGYDYFRLRTYGQSFDQCIDDGTAGPFDIGFDFNFFDKPTRYAFIGVNGGIALGETLDDTLHLNSNDYFLKWDIPSSQMQPMGMPKNFIAPMWLDFKLLSFWFTCDSGKIFVKNEKNRFIVQWVNLGNYINDTDCTTNFELIIDNADTSITFLYKSIGWSNLVRYSTIGFEQDTTSWFKLYGNNFPEQFIPRGGQAIKLKRKVFNNLKEDEKIPVSFLLDQNYPNPFNVSTVINFQLPIGGYVIIKIYNQLGEEVRTLLNSNKEAGYHSVSFNADGMASGIYYYKVNVFDRDKKLLFVDVKKMIIIK